MDKKEQNNKASLDEQIGKNDVADTGMDRQTQTQAPEEAQAQRGKDTNIHTIHTAIDEAIDTAIDTTDGIEADIDFSRQIEESKRMIESLQEQVDVLQDKLLRSMAESENIRARSSKLAEEARDYSITSFAKDLVPVMDNIGRALQHIPENMDKETKILFDGVKMTSDEFQSVFKKHNIEPISPLKGDKFDYNLHNAISQITTAEFPEGTIVNTMQVGYKIKDRLLRPAAVTVAKK